MQLIGRWAACTGRSDEAAEWYDAALERSPDRVEWYLDYASLLRDAQQADEANELIEEMVDKNKDSRDARLQAVNYFRQFHLWDKAEKHVTYAVEKLGQQGVDVLLLAADVAQAKTRAADARKYLERACQLHPRDPRVLLALARLEFREGHRPEALALLEECLKGGSGDEEQLLGLG
jgi:tetratricopeptide (TPR) repeat protein